MLIIDNKKSKTIKATFGKIIPNIKPFDWIPINGSWVINLETADGLIHLNNAVLNNELLPKSLKDLNFSDSNGLFISFCDVYVFDSCRGFVKNLELKFGNWDNENLTIRIIATGIVDIDDYKEDVLFSFEEDFKFIGWIFDGYEKFQIDSFFKNIDINGMDKLIKIK